MQIKVKTEKKKISSNNVELVNVFQLTELSSGSEWNMHEIWGFPHGSRHVIGCIINSSHTFPEHTLTPKSKVVI